MKKRIAALFLALVTMLGCAFYMPLEIFAATNKKIVISSVDDWMKELSGKSVSNTDVTVTAKELDFEGRSVKPVLDFNGSFDGQGVIIKNIDMRFESDVALFCSVGQGAYIKNIIIKESSFVATKNWAATIACCVGGTATIENIYVCNDVMVASIQKYTATETASSGGIVGGCYGSSGFWLTVNDCVFAGRIEVSCRGAGGIVGNGNSKQSAKHNISINRCLMTGTAVSSVSDCNGIVGMNQYATTTLTGCIYAGGGDAVYPLGKADILTVSDCYTVKLNGSGYAYNSESRDQNSGVNVYSADSLTGLKGVTFSGWTRRNGEIMLPSTICEIIPETFTQKLYDGAAVRFSYPTGLRFIATLNGDFLESIKEKEQGRAVTFGMLIAPTDHIAETDGIFTVEALEGLEHSRNYLLIPAENLISGGEAEGYYTFSGVLSEIKEENYTRSFSARAYVMAEDGNGSRTFYYSSFDPVLNSRSIASVAKKAYADVIYQQTDRYAYEAEEGTGMYSPYSPENRDMLTSFYANGDYTQDITPEEFGISSKDITAVLNGFEDAGLSMHSLVIMKNGEIIAETYADPYDENSLHRMYSVSKSFVAMAIGLLESEGKISINDTIDKYFPDYVTSDTHEYIAKCKIVDLLRMASPFNDGSTYDGDTDMNWTETFFDAKVDKKPGTSFLYDTSATHILGVIVERVTGMDFLEYLKKNALLEIGFSENAWCVKAPEGYAWGGSGVMCTSRDLAAFANLVMNMGEYNGKQLLPADYVKAATSYQISTAPDPDSDTPYYGSGYGYQIWMNPYGFAFMGMGGQVAYCIPDKGLVIVCTADNQGNSDATEVVYRLLEKYIINTASKVPLGEDPLAYATLMRELANMKIPCQTGAMTSSSLDSINGKTYVCRNYGASISSFRLDFNGDEGVLTYNTPRGEKKLHFGIGKNVECILDEPQYSGEYINHPNGEGYRSLCSGAWRSDTVFVLKVQVIDDYLGNMTMIFDLDGTPTLSVTKTAEWFLNEYKMSNVSYRKQ